MAATREDIRDHLTAVIEAARELPKDDRSYLADVFLDELETQFQLVPRSQRAPRTEADLGRPRVAGFRSGWGPVPVGVLLVLAVLLLPVLLLPLFTLAHPPVFLLALVLLLLFRFGRPGMRHRRRWGYGPSRRDTPHYYL